MRHTLLDSFPHAYTEVTVFNLPQILIVPYAAKPRYQNSHSITGDSAVPH